MARQRDPRAVLGVRRGASAAEIKAAWRQLARQNHPDLTGDDPAASQSATRRMAEINDAYESLTRIAAKEAERHSRWRRADIVRHRRCSPPHGSAADRSRRGL